MDGEELVLKIFQELLYVDSWDHVVFLCSFNLSEMSAAESNIFRTFHK